jgi:hypothetical protein
MLSSRETSRLAALTFGAVFTLTSYAHAHFKLLLPDSWLKEGATGEPQKASPCGPGGYDDVQPIPTSGAITTVHAGDTIQVELQETIYHPGYFRIALAENRADLKDPPLTNDTTCSLDLASVPSGAHDNVLLDGIAKTSDSFGSNRHIMQDVKLPATPCEKCTLQVIQVMKDHGPPNCFYWHCADLKILPADGSGSSGAGGVAGAAAGGSGAAGAGGAGGGLAGSSAGSNAAGSGMAGAAAAAGSGTGVAGRAGVAGSTPAPAGTGTAGTSAVSAGSVAAAGRSGAAGLGAMQSGVGTAGAATNPTSTAAPASSAKSSSCTAVELRSTGPQLPGAILGFAALVWWSRNRRRRSAT